MPNYPQDAFTFFSNFNRSKIEGKENEYWAKAEFPIEEIEKFFNWAMDPSTKKVINNKGEQCVVVNQKLLPKVAKTSGNSYLLGITSGKKEEIPF